MIFIFFIGCAKKVCRIDIEGSFAAKPLITELSDVFMQDNPHYKIVIKGGGTQKGIESVLQGRAHIGMVSRELTDKEILSGVKPILIARDVLSVIVHPSNPIEDLSLSDIREIFSGKITNWKEFGWIDAPIIVVVRPYDSGSFRSFSELVMKKEKIVDSAKIQITSRQLRSKVAELEESIGFLSLGLLDETVKPLKINGIYPSPSNVAKGNYPLYRPFYLLLKDKPQNFVKDFIDFILSKTGQELVEKKSYVRVD